MKFTYIPKRSGYYFFQILVFVKFFIIKEYLFLIFDLLHKITIIQLFRIKTNIANILSNLNYIYNSKSIGNEHLSEKMTLIVIHLDRISLKYHFRSS